MSTITVADEVRQKLEDQARARGLDLASYLAHLADEDSSKTIRAGTSAGTVGDAIRPILDSIKHIPLEPIPPSNDKAPIPADVIERYRKMGFRW